MNIEKDLGPLKEVLYTLRKEGKILAALLYGSFAKGTPHKRSDIDTLYKIAHRALHDSESIRFRRSIRD